MATDLDRPGHARADAAKLVCHTHNDLPAKGVPDEYLWEQLQLTE